MLSILHPEYYFRKREMSQDVSDLSEVRSLEEVALANEPTSVSHQSPRSLQSAWVTRWSREQKTHTEEADRQPDRNPF